MITLIIHMLGACFLFLLSCILLFIFAAKPLRDALEIYKQISCDHEWEKENKIPVYFGQNDKRPIYYDHSIRCKWCGFMKKWKT